MPRRRAWPRPGYKLLSNLAGLYLLSSSSCTLLARLVNPAATRTFTTTWHRSRLLLTDGAAQSPAGRRDAALGAQASDSRAALRGHHHHRLPSPQQQGAAQEKGMPGAAEGSCQAVTRQRRVVEQRPRPARAGAVPGSTPHTSCRGGNARARASAALPRGGGGAARHAITAATAAPLPAPYPRRFPLPAPLPASRGPVCHADLSDVREAHAGGRGGESGARALPARRHRVRHRRVPPLPPRRARARRRQRERARAGGAAQRPRQQPLPRAALPAARHQPAPAPGERLREGGTDGVAALALGKARRCFLCAPPGST